MLTKAESSFAAIRGLVNDPYEDYTSPDYLLGFMNTAQNLLFNEMLGMPIISRPMAIILLPSIGVGTTTLKRFFAAGQPLQFLEEITSMKERAQTSTSESDWKRMNITNDIPGFTPGSFNHVYVFSGDDIVLPGADQDLQVRIFGAVNPQPLSKPDSYLIPSTRTIIELRAAGLIALTRGSKNLEMRYLGVQGMNNGMADVAQQAYMQRIVQALQERPVRQKGFSGRIRNYL